LPRTTVRPSFGATRIQQLSHHTLTLAFAFSIFAVFMVPSGFLWLTRHLLKARYLLRGVIRLMSALIHRARQHKFSRRHRLAFFRSIALVESEQNRHAALLAANSEIPAGVGFGPSRNIQRLSLPFEMSQLSLLHGGTGLTPRCFMIAIAHLHPVSILIVPCIRRNNGHVRFDPDYCSDPGLCSLNVFRSSRMRVRVCSFALR